MCVAFDPSHMDQVREGGEEGCVGSVSCTLCVSGRPRWGGAGEGSVDHFDCVKVIPQDHHRSMGEDVGEVG